MVDPLHPSPEEEEDFAGTREHEYQDAHYHDEDPDIVNDEVAPHAAPSASNKKKTRRPAPKPRYYEE